jgi:hypothetical protein
MTPLGQWPKAQRCPSDGGIFLWNTNILSQETDFHDYADTRTTGDVGDILSRMSFKNFLSARIR